MYATTPPAASGRRNTRSARGTKRRRQDRNSGGGLKRQFEEAALRPAKTWVQILRSPAPQIRFRVKTWVLLDDLTEQERIEWQAKNRKDTETPKSEGEATSTVRETTTTASEPEVPAPTPAEQPKEEEKQQEEDITPKDNFSTEDPLEMSGDLLSDGLDGDFSFF